MRFHFARRFLDSTSVSWLAGGNEISGLASSYVATRPACNGTSLAVVTDCFEASLNQRYGGHQVLMHGLASRL